MAKSATTHKISGPYQGCLRLATWKAHKSSISRLSLHPEGNLLATVGQDGEIKLWKIDSFEQLMIQVCSWMDNYLNYNSTIADSDRSLCDGIR